MAEQPERKRRKRRLPPSKPPTQEVKKSLAERIETEAEEEILSDEEVALMQPLNQERVGVLGTTNFIEYGSAEHAALLGLDPEDPDDPMAMMFDLSTATDKQIEMFHKSRLKWLASGPGTIPPGCPKMFNPDELLGVTEL